jgi:hypothetical protein
VHDVVAVQVLQTLHKRGSKEGLGVGGLGFGVRRSSHQNVPAPEVAVDDVRACKYSNGWSKEAFTLFKCFPIIKVKEKVCLETRMFPAFMPCKYFEPWRKEEVPLFVSVSGEHASSDLQAQWMKIARFCHCSKSCSCNT